MQVVLHNSQEFVQHKRSEFHFMVEQAPRHATQRVQDVSGASRMETFLFCGEALLAKTNRVGSLEASRVSPKPRMGGRSVAKKKKAAKKKAGGAKKKSKKSAKKKAKR
jgi:hypothetical protein